LDLAIFEVGPIFHDVLDEKLSVAAMRSGRYVKKDCHDHARDVDIYDIKTDFSVLVEQLGFDFDKLLIDTTAELPIYYHPTRSAAVILGKNIIGYFGQVHPKICIKYDLKSTPVVFEMCPDYLPTVTEKNKSDRKKEFIASCYQPVRRDFAFVLAVDISVGDIVRSIKSVDKILIRNVDVVDIYRGSSISSDKKSVAFSVMIQSDIETLNEKQINGISDKIVSVVFEKYSGELRK
jgi:phenylalanyl-tRNA synthetase beta chain